MRLIKGLLDSKLETDNPEILSALSNRYAFKVPGYNYVPAYRTKRWDGNTRYFSKSGKFKTGILNRLLKDQELIQVQDLTIEEADNLSYPTFDEVKNVKSFKYRDYQKEAILHCCNTGRAIVDSPVGSGKTLIMAGVIKTLLSNKKLKALILFKEKGILNQTYRFFEKVGLKNLGINSGEGLIHGDIMLSTVQSLDKIVDYYLNCDLLMIDEAHQFCKGAVTIAAIESFPNARYRFAFTATVPSEKYDIHGRLTLEGAFGSVYSTKSIDDLIKEGSLAEPNIQIIEYSPSSYCDDMSYQEIYEEHIVNSIERNNAIKFICDSIFSKNDDAKILILVKNLQHIENLNDILQHDNIFCIKGENSIEDRYEMINSFLERKNSIIIGTNVMQTGISIDEITHMVNARGLEGEIPTIQGLGRGVRKAVNKKVIYFYDFYDKVKYLEKHSKKRIKHYEGLKLKVNYAKLN